MKIALQLLKIILAFMLTSCGSQENIQEEKIVDSDDKKEEKKVEINIPINVSLVSVKEGARGLMLLEDLAHEIQISNCISFASGEVKTVESSTTTPAGSIPLYLGDTGCTATLVKFRHEGQWYVKAPAGEQPPAETETELFTSGFGDTSKNFFIRNYSVLDQIKDSYSLVKFSVWKSFERNQEERSIPIGTATTLTATTFEDLLLPRFYVESVKKDTASGIQLVFQLRCDTSPSAANCNGALGTPANIDFYLFKRASASEKTYTIDQIIASVTDQTVAKKNIANATISDISVSETNRFTLKFDIDASYLASGTNNFTFVTATNDSYAPGDYYSKSYRYHVLDLDYTP